MSLNRNVSKHTDAPIPHAAADSSRSVGTALTRVIPLLSTQVTAIIRTPRVVQFPPQLACRLGRRPTLLLVHPGPHFRTDLPFRHIGATLPQASGATTVSRGVAMPEPAPTATPAADTDSRPGAAPQPVRLAGRRPLRRPHGPQHGRQHQPTADRPALRPCRPARLLPLRPGRPAGRLRVRPALPVLPARRFGLRVRRRDARATRGRRVRCRPARDLHVLRGRHVVGGGHTGHGVPERACTSGRTRRPGHRSCWSPSR